MKRRDNRFSNILICIDHKFDKYAIALLMLNKFIINDDYSTYDDTIVFADKNYRRNPRTNNKIHPGFKWAQVHNFNNDVQS